MHALVFIYVSVYLYVCVRKSVVRVPNPFFAAESAPHRKILSKVISITAVGAGQRDGRSEELETHRIHCVATVSKSLITQPLSRAATMDRVLPVPPPSTPLQWRAAPNRRMGKIMVEPQSLYSKKKVFFALQPPTSHKYTGTQTE